MTYFETKFTSQNCSAKRNSKSDIVLLVSKLIIVLLFGFFGNNGDNSWLLAIVLFLLAFFIYITYQEEQPYYNPKIMKMYNIVTAIFLWNTIVLLIGKVIEGSKFNGCIEMFFIGIPFIVILIVTNNDDKITLLLTNINKFQKGDTVITQVKYFLDLVDRKDTDRDAKVLLKGYVQMYEESCNNEDCALKKYLYGVKNGMDTVVFLYQHAELIFQNGISRFTSCTSLRLSYSFFLLERLNKKQQATLELNNTLKYGPRFEEQFIIYRYKKLIEEYTSDVAADSEESLDVVSNIAYKNHFTQCKLFLI